MPKPKFSAQEMRLSAEVTILREVVSLCLARFALVAPNEIETVADRLAQYRISNATEGLYRSDVGEEAEWHLLIAESVRWIREGGELEGFGDLYYVEG